MLLLLQEDWNIRHRYVKENFYCIIDYTTYLNKNVINRKSYYNNRT